MSNLGDDLELLYELNELRDRAKKLRRSGLMSLKGIKDISIDGKITAKDVHDDKYYKNWITSRNEVEVALIVRAQSHREMSDDDEADASPQLKGRLKSITLKSLFPSLSKTIQPLSGEAGHETDEYIDIRVYKKKLGGSDDLTITEKFIEFVDSTVPVLVAARVMHALVGRAETVFSRATMICYYRIVRELYFAAQPDWIIGAARANAGGDASAFVTGECIRAILAFEHAILRTVAFFRNTRHLLQQHRRLEGMLDGFGAGPEHPLSLWADKVIERMWLDWYISTNPRRGEIAVKQVLTNLPEEVNMKSVGAYLDGLRTVLETHVKEAKKEIERAGDEIDKIREEQNPYQDGKEKPFKAGSGEDEERVYQQNESAHKVAYRAVRRGITETKRAQEDFFGNNPLEVILNEFVEQFEDISRRIHRVLEPAKRYVRGVVNRELALAATESGRFDPGELAFAAASLGATTDWRKNERLTRACELLAKSLPDSGSLLTRRPFHSNTRGYRLMPIGCEMARSFAQLLQKADYAFEPKLVHRMLNIFEEKRIPPSLPSLTIGQGQSEERVAWNFEGAPHPERPCAWVTSVAVLALDRIVRMLNERINAIVLKHFEVIRPENPHTNLGLNDLLYPDYGLSDSNGHGGRSIAIRLEQMRAHVERAMLPRAYKDKSGKMEKVSSVILYGPPGTGKTTLVEALALSSRAPLIRLSPSDLTVQGHELIEGRARDVFEALSMLTQAVIILDEFEPVLRDRDPANKGAKSKPDDPIFNFLVTGMLPKLVKLNDAARRQSLVYCLSTNFMETIDSAAKRSGRFDLHLSIYPPDPLSRAGEFLYRIAPPPPEARSVSGEREKEREIRLLSVVSDTAYTPSGELAEVYFKPDEDSTCSKYYWMGGVKEYKIKKRKELNPDEEGLSDDERKERRTIREWEGRVKKLDVEQMGQGSDMVAFCLAPPGNEG